MSPNTDLLEDIGRVDVKDLTHLSDLRELLTSDLLKNKPHFGFLTKDLKFVHPRRETLVTVDAVILSQVRVKFFQDHGKKKLYVP